MISIGSYLLTLWCLHQQVTNSHDWHHLSGALNPIHNKKCQSCGASFENKFNITLEEACRDGGIISGMDLNEEEMLEGEKIGPGIIKGVQASNDTILIDMLRRLPPESYGRLNKIMRNK